MEHNCTQVDKLSKLSEMSALNANDLKQMTYKIDQIETKVDKIYDKLETFSLWLINLQSYVETKDRDVSDNIKEWTQKNFAPVNVKTIVYSMVWMILAAFLWALITITIK